jgi:hypothetical protein
MNLSDFDDFRNVVAGFAELKGKSLSDAAIELYWGAMQHWEMADFKAAAHHLLRACEFMPTPADFEQLRRAALPSGREAWPVVHRWIQGFGGPPGDPIAVAAIESMGGRRALSQRKADDAPWTAKEFADVYDGLRDAREARKALPHLSQPQMMPALLGPDSDPDAPRH